VRRDHSISLSDRSKTRKAEAMKPGAGGSGRRVRAGVSMAAGVCSTVAYFTRYWNTAARLSSGDVTSSIDPYCPLAAISVSRA